MGQHYALLWLIELSHRDVTVTRRDAAPMGFLHYLADTTNATLVWRHHLVPLNLFSTAKVNILFETTKFFGDYFALASEIRMPYIADKKTTNTHTA